jgi:hypothetical protein
MNLEEIDFEKLHADLWRLSKTSYQINAHRSAPFFSINGVAVDAEINIRNRIDNITGRKPIISMDSYEKSQAIYDTLVDLGIIIKGKEIDAVLEKAGTFYFVGNILHTGPKP